MVRKPDMIQQFSRHLATELRRQGYDRIEVRTHALISLNRREPQPLIDPSVNLASQPRPVAGAPWILPLKAPLSDDASEPESTTTALEEP
jgi:vitamin K-dependent gamma-carboxylase